MEPGGTYWVARGGTLIALRVGTQPAAEAGFRIIGAHTDSPNLRIKPSPDLRREGCLQLGVEAYGGLLDYTWLDRDLGLTGEVAVRGDGSGPPVEMRLVRIDTPILRIPSLAIHLNRGLRKEGLKLNRQQHLPPILGLGETGGRGRQRGRGDAAAARRGRGPRGATRSSSSLARGRSRPTWRTPSTQTGSIVTSPGICHISAPGR